MISWSFKITNRRKSRHHRLRGRIQGTSERPRLFVFRSSKHIYAQLIDDDQAKVLASASDIKLDSKNRKDISFAVGKDIAQKAKAANITKVVFDRGGYKYHGHIKAVAEGARGEGLEF